MQNLKWATTHLSRRLGAGCAQHAGWARRRGAQVGARARGVGVQPGHAGWAVGCALGALSLFLTRFDSVLFLSQFLDIVREPGSCTLFITIFFEKKIIKLNKKK